MSRVSNIRFKAGSELRIYPDFFFAVQRGDDSAHITVLETKGGQLDNLDSA